ncbi:hypothetical protein, partial [Streptomyces sp. NPDC057794]|uniref:hypothetical protein n=1 Tax=Streptomyces sp. NPDC057794 TaxID=3346251 RepID=UPI00368A33C1
PYTRAVDGMVDNHASQNRPGRAEAGAPGVAVGVLREQAGAPGVAAGVPRVRGAAGWITLGVSLTSRSEECVCVVAWSEP